MTVVGAMDAELSRPDWLATVQSGRKQVQSRVCTPSLSGRKARPTDVPYAEIQRSDRYHPHCKLNLDIADVSIGSSLIQRGISPQWSN